MFNALSFLPSIATVGVSLAGGAGLSGFSSLGSLAAMATGPLLSAAFGGGSGLSAGVSGYLGTGIPTREVPVGIPGSYPNPPSLSIPNPYPGQPTFGGVQVTSSPGEPPSPPGTNPPPGGGPPPPPGGTEPPPGQLPGGYPNPPPVGIPGGYPNPPPVGIPGGYPNQPPVGIPGGYPNQPPVGIPYPYPAFGSGVGWTAGAVGAGVLQAQAAVTGGRAVPGPASYRARWLRLNTAQTGDGRTAMPGSALHAETGGGEFAVRETYAERLRRLQASLPPPPRPLDDWEDLRPGQYRRIPETPGIVSVNEEGDLVVNAPGQWGQGDRNFALRLEDGQIVLPDGRRLPYGKGGIHITFLDSKGNRAFSVAVATDDEGRNQRWLVAGPQDPIPPDAQVNRSYEMAADGTFSWVAGS